MEEVQGRLAVLVDGVSIFEVTMRSIVDAHRWVERLSSAKTPLNKREQAIGNQILKEIRERLGFMVDVGLDYLTLDFLTEVTMSVLQKQRARDPDLGYAVDFLELMRESLPLLEANDTKVITNAGGLNPPGLRRKGRGDRRLFLESSGNRLPGIQHRTGRVQRLPPSPCTSR